MRRKKNKSIVPAQAQVPAAIVLAILFAGILYWRFAPASKSNLAEASVKPAAPVSAASDVSAVSADEVQKLLDELKAGRVENVERPPEPPPLACNPFFREAPPLPELDPAAQESAGAPADDHAHPARKVKKTDREEVIASMSLSGTCVSGKTALAIINGHTVRRGDKIKGFTVRGIMNSKVLLKDKKGEVTLTVSRPKHKLVQDDAGEARPEDTP